MEIDSLAHWLDLTQQQASIVSIIHRLQSRKATTNPVQIEKEYFHETKTFIQKSNLFTQLKLLQEKSILLKIAQSQYTLNIEGIRQEILSRKKNLSEEVEQLGRFMDDTSSFFDTVVNPSSVSATYLHETELYSKLAFYLRNANAFYLGCDFPHYAYSFALCSSSQQAAYIEILNERLHDPAFSLFCLTPYNFDSLQQRLRRKYKNEQLILEEIRTADENAKKKTQQFSTIDLRRTITPFDFALIENKEMSDGLFMFLKDSTGDITGAIFISSYETTKQVKGYFLTQMTHTQPLKITGDFPPINLSSTQLLPRKKKLIAFDVNRIFTQNHTTVELGKLIGKEKQVQAYITQQIEGGISVQDAISKSAKLLKGLPVDEINRFMAKLPLMKNVREGLAKLKDAGYYMIAISTGFSHIIEPLCKELGIDEIYCNVLDEKDGKLTGEILEKNVVIDNVKYYIVKYCLEKYSIPEEESVAVGDGFSDLDMLKAVHTRIAFNPSKKIVELYEQKSPLISKLVEQNDFLILAATILKRS